MAEIRSVEHRQRLPLEMLGTIARVESGRVDPVTSRMAPWPWTINVEGVGYFYETKQQAMDAVVRWQSGGHRSIDVGCMQINLKYHPQAFASLDDAFDPHANVEYAARFLTDLRQQLGAWPAAIAAYHSQTPDLGGPYWDKVLSGWRLASRYTDGMASNVRTRLATNNGAPPTITSNSPELARRLAEVQQDHRRILAGGLNARFAERPPASRLILSASRS